MTTLIDRLNQAFSEPVVISDHRTILKRAARMKKPLPRFDFGKHNGRPVGDVFRDDPGYIVWCWNNVQRSKLPFIEELYERARAIVDEYDRERAYTNYDQDHEWDILDGWALEIANDS